MPRLQDRPLPAAGAALILRRNEGGGADPPPHRDPTAMTATVLAGVRRAPAPSAAGLLALVRAWIGRARSRADLADLDDRMLADVGLTRAEALAEADRPFWR